MSDPLALVSDDGHTVVLRQPEFADAWEFSVQLHGCLNFGQHDPAKFDPENPSTNGETLNDHGWVHVCDLDLFIAMLQQVKRERDARLAAAPAAPAEGGAS